jgi:hypothetical protein
MDDPIDTAWPAAFDGVVVSRALDGVARFPHAGEWLAAEPKSSELALLAFPVANRIELRFGSAAADARRELVVPPLGRVVLSFPGVARASRSSHNDAVGETEMRPFFWRDRARAAIVDGKATFPFVGVGAGTTVPRDVGGAFVAGRGAARRTAARRRDRQYAAGSRTTPPSWRGSSTTTGGPSRTSNSRSWCGDRDGRQRQRRNFVATADTEVACDSRWARRVGGRRTVRCMDSWNAKDSKIGWAATTVDLAAIRAVSTTSVTWRFPGSRAPARLHGRGL